MYGLSVCCTTHRLHTWQAATRKKILPQLMLYTIPNAVVETACHRSSLVDVSYMQCIVQDEVHSTPEHQTTYRYNLKLPMHMSTGTRTAGTWSAW